jgi:hypothetical protein
MQKVGEGQMPLPKRKKEEQVMEYSFENIGTGTIPVMAEMRYRIGNKKGWIWVGVYLLLDLYYLRKFMIGDLPLVFALIFISITLYLVMLPYLRLRKAYKKEKAFYDGVIPELTTRFGENIYISNTAASSSVKAMELSTTASTRSAVSTALRLRSTPMRSTTSSVSRMPAVSMSRRRTPPQRTDSSTVSRVVPGMLVTIARS